MLDEGYAHILATDAHDVDGRPPNLGEGRELASKRVGELEAEHLVLTRPRGMLLNQLPSDLLGSEGAIRSRAVYADRRGKSDETGEKRRSQR